MTEYWMTSQELKDLTGWPDRTIQRKAEAGQLKFRAADERKPNGRHPREYSSLSLPTDLQVESNSRRVASSLTVHSDEKPTGAELVIFPTQPNCPRSTQIVLFPKQEAQVAERKAIVAPLFEYAQLNRGPARNLWCKQNGREVKNLEDLAKQIGMEQNSSRTTILRWYGFVKAGFPEKLADQVRADKGLSRWFNRHRTAAIFAAYLYLNERQSVTFVCEQIERDAERLGIEIGDLPSRETVRIFLSREISPAMRTLAREGQQEYRERMSPYLRRGYVDVFSNQIWVGDHMIHDVEVANDLFDDAPIGAPVRLRLSAMLDFHSRKLVGATWAWEGSSRAIAATMRRAILQYGPPEGVYFDNGKDYLKVAKGARRGCEGYLAESPLAPDHWWQSELEGIERTGFLARLGISATHCIARHPQSKHVERWFRTLHTRFDSVHSTYTSGSPFTRPDRTESAMMQHRRLFKKGRAAESEHPAASRFILGCLSWIEEYNATPHRGQGMDGRSPNEVFEQDFNPNQKPTPEAATLALLMAEYEKRQVRECAVTLRKRRYMPRPEDRLAWAAMDEANEREILIAYDPADLDFAAALDLDGRFLAWLEAEVLLRFAPGDPETQARIGDSMQTRRGLEKAHKQTLKEIAATARADGARSAEEMLYGRLQLPAVTGAVITQRKPGMRPDKEAVAPMSAADIAANLLRDLGWEKAV
jgi:putative transposase